MNVFNRIVVMLLEALLIAGAALVLLVTLGALAPQQVLPAGTSETALGQWLESFTAMPPTMTLLVTLLAGLSILLGLFLLALELRPAPQERTLAIREDGLGRVTVRLESVRDLIVYTAAHLPGVLQVKPTIDRGPQGLTIHCRTSLTPEAHIPQVTAELQSRIKQTIERHLGMKVAVVTVQAQLEPLAGMEIPHRSRAARRVLR